MQRELNGVVIIDKPTDRSSAKVLAEVKAIYQVAKAGHGGTLDPFATGVLVCCLNQATRLSRFFLHSRKTYEAVLRLGVETDTQDATGQEIHCVPVPPLSEARVREVAERFEGQQMQQPPVYSALKHQGTPLYKLARQGRPVRKPPRSVMVYKIDLVKMDLPDIRMTVTCSAGTYIRTLCADIGKTLGCGGHLIALRRTASSGFGIDEAVSIEALKAMDPQRRSAIVIPMADALRGMPAFIAEADLCHRIAHGQPLSAEDLPSETLPREGFGAAGDQWIKVVDRRNQLKAVVEVLPDGGYNYGCVFS